MRYLYYYHWKINYFLLYFIEKLYVIMEFIENGTHTYGVVFATFNKLNLR